MNETQRRALANILQLPATKECAEALRKDLTRQAVAKSPPGCNTVEEKAAYREEHMYMLWAFEKLLQKMGANADYSTDEGDQTK